MDRESYRSPEVCENYSNNNASDKETWLPGDRIEFRDPANRQLSRDAQPAWLPGIVQEIQSIGPSWARSPRHMYWIKAGRYTYRCKSIDMRRPACHA